MLARLPNGTAQCWMLRPHANDTEKNDYPQPAPGHKREFVIADASANLHLG
jgi:hypothetical protein